MCSEKPMGDGTGHRARRELDVSVMPRYGRTARWMAARGAKRSRRGGREAEKREEPAGISEAERRSDRSWLIAGGAAFAEGERGARPELPAAADGTAAFSGAPRALRRELPFSAGEADSTQPTREPANQNSSNRAPDNPGTAQALKWRVRSRAAAQCRADAPKAPFTSPTVLRTPRRV